MADFYIWQVKKAIERAKAINQRPDGVTPNKASVFLLDRKSYLQYLAVDLKPDAVVAAYMAAGDAEKTDIPFTDLHFHLCSVERQFAGRITHYPRPLPFIIDSYVPGLLRCKLLLLISAES